MSKETIIDNDFVTLWFHPETKIVHHQFKKFVPTNQLKEILNKGTDLLESRKAKKWLSDDRKNGAIPKDFEEWSTTNWRPRTVKAGWKFWAILIPEAMIGQLNMQRKVKEFGQAGIIAQFFTDTTEAMKWLEKQQ